MDIVNIINELYVFASTPRCFTFSELLDFADPSVDPVVLRPTLLDQSRFISSRSESPEEERFILDSALFTFFSQLNIRLSEIRQFRLTEQQIAFAMNHLRSNGRWDSPPVELIQWGQSLGLIRTCWTQGQYVFPLARILSFLNPSHFAVASNILAELCENQVWQFSQKKWLENSLQKGFSLFKKNVAYTVKGREAFLTGKKMTLEEIGGSLKCTREYARQLENKFCKNMRSPHGYSRPFLKALLCDFMDESGSLIVCENSFKANVRKFLARCNFIPQVKLSRIGFVVLAALEEELTSLKSPNWLPNEIDGDIIAKRLESESKICLADRDIQELVEKVVQFRNKRLTKSQRVYLALHDIGRPAHYSEIASVYNSLWPDHASTERNIHATLCREQYGVVWIGIHGTFALKKWGWEHPSIKLFDAVAEIVQKKHEETGAPVPFVVINSEIGKYRKIVKPSSLIFATHCNPRLKQVTSDTFIPRGLDDKHQDDISLEQLDKIFDEFRQNNF